MTGVRRPSRVLLAATFACWLPRIAAATVFLVDSKGDTLDAVPGDNVCADANGDCTLRAAILEANAHGGLDAITLPLGTYVLTRAGANENDGETGDLDISGALTIQGAAADGTVVDAAGLDRVFHILVSDVTLDGLTIRGGAADGGGGIRNAGFDFACNDCVIRANLADGAVLGGGGVLSLGTATLTRCRISGNRSVNDGGGVSARGDSAIVTVADSVVSHNEAAVGGGLAVLLDAFLTVERVEISANRASVGGGGLAAHTVRANLNNVTCSGNRAPDGGCARVLPSGALVMNNATVTLNRATGEGGGVDHNGSFGDFEISNTILASNFAPSGPECEGDATSTVGHNLVEVTSGCTLHGTITGNVTAVDPLLEPLANNRGLSRTHALPSAAAAAGDAAHCETTDQRGVTRGATCDMGAYERDNAGLPVELRVDPDGNDVLEAGEDVVLAPTVRETLASTFLGSTALSFEGPGDPLFFDYLLSDATASYGTVAAGATANCAEATGNCFGVEISPLLPLRPLPHWDTHLVESGPGSAGQMPVDWHVHVGLSFLDVPTSFPQYRRVEALFHHGLSAGCGGGRFCPDDAVQRQQLALALVRAAHSQYSEPACLPPFGFVDVDATNPFCGAILQLLADFGLQSACAPNNFCPTAAVTRGQAAKLVVLARHGSLFTPPACSDLFTDLEPGDPLCPWVEQLAADAPSAPCAAARFCPYAPLTRSQLASVLAEAFGLDVWSLGL